MRRHQLPHSGDSEYEPGSNQEVLRNFLHVTNRRQMEELETLAYESAVNDSVLHLESDQRLSTEFLREMHRRWLGDIYPFAGQLRTVNVSKDFVTFCPVANLATQFQNLDRDVLTPYTPCDQLVDEDLAKALAIVHVEFILVHPFREGNGRLGRWLAILMALQAGRPILDFSFETTEAGRQRYFAALRRGFLGDLGPATSLFVEILTRSSS